MKLQRSRRRTEINAVYEEDLHATFEALGVQAAFERGKLICTVCGQQLAEGGLGAVRRSKDTLVFACGRLECVRQMSKQDG